MPDDNRLPRDEYLKLCRQNAGSIGEELDALERDHRCDNDLVRAKDFFAHAGRIRSLFKQLKLQHSERQQLWERLNNICDDARRSLDQWKERSGRKRDSIMAFFDDVHWKIEAAEEPQLLHEASEVLEKALLAMKSGWEHCEFIDRFITETFTTDQGILTAEDRQACFERYKEVREELRVKRFNLSHTNRSILGDRIGEAWNRADTDPREASTMLKQIQADLKETVLTKEDREAVWNDLQNAWEAVKGAFDRQRGQREERLEEIKERQEAFRDQLVEEIEELEEKIADAWSDDFRERAEERVEHKRAKLEQVEHGIRELEEKLERVRR